MNSWQYHTEQFEATGFMGGIIDQKAFEKKLNELGRQGWELVTVFDTNMAQGQSRFIVAVFKRAVE